MTGTIKFSRTYKKMPNDYQWSTLIEVIVVNINDLSGEFLEYDTKFLHGPGHYRLRRDGKFLILFLLTKYGQLWTTIRSWNQGKEKYYRDQIGTVQTIIVER